MPSSLDHVDWSGFLRRPRLPSPPLEVFDALYQLSILVTGAGGSIASALAVRLSVLAPPRLVVLEASESQLFKLQQQWVESRCACPITPVLGSVSDASLVEALFASHAPKLVFHAAAFKHVPLLEEQPLAAILNNIFATKNLVAAAARHGARVVLLSTDKAVEPTSMMGATKRVSEQLVLAAGGIVLRLGNVLASTDSVAQIFAQQIERGGPVTVTDPAARRYFLTLDEAVNLLLLAATVPDGSRLLAPILPTQHFISDLAHFLADTLAPGKTISLDFTAPRPGDKQAEKFWAERDVAQPIGAGGMASIQAERPDARMLHESLKHLRLAAEGRDLPTALMHLQRLVPDYRPSGAVLAQARPSALQASR